MKKSYLTLLSGILFSVFLILSCSSGADPTPAIVPIPLKVDFNDNGNIIKSVDVLFGSFLTSDDKPSDPYKTYNYFSYWSESKASKDAAVEFNFSQPIFANKTLYAIYTPKLSSSAIQTVSLSQVEIKLLDDKVFPLEDGSYVNISFKYSSDGTNYQDFAVNNIPSSSRDTSDHYRYLTYDFLNVLPAGTHYLRVTNGQETYTKSFTVDSPAAVTNLTSSAGDSYAKISFKTAAAGYSYTVKAYKNGVEVASTQVLATSKNTNKDVEFFGLENGYEYTFKVITGSTNLSEQTTATPTLGTQKESDWLVVMYMDGDNNLNDPIFLDMNEVEYGLWYIRNTDDSPDSSHDSVNAVALWDGVVSYQALNDAGEQVTQTPQIGKSGTYIYELGRDSGNSITYTSSPGCVLSSNTKNLSYTAPWLFTGISTDSSNDTHGELNMGDKQTLINFLNWVNAHYTANKGVILQFSNHGAGPRSVRFVQTPDGRTLKIGGEDGRRALCQDLTSSNALLKTKDVSDALSAAGYGPSNKAAMILMDVCLGSSLEDAYQFRNYANYLAASPNNIPGMGLDYNKLMRAFSKNTTIEEVGKKIVSDYKAQYGNDTTTWNKYAYAIYGKNYYSSLDSTQKNKLEWFGDLGITTFTITDLSKVTDVKTAIDSLYDVLLSAEGIAKTIYVDSNGYFSTTATGSTQNYVTYLGNHYVNIITFIQSLTAQNLSQYNHLEDYLYYQGTYTWLYDIGYIAKNIKDISAEDVDGSSNANAWPELNSAATNVINKLDAAIKYSWRDSKLASNSDFYTRIDSRPTLPEFDHYLGLSICGANIATNGTSLVQGTAPGFYKTDLAFGTDSKWGDLLIHWFGAGN